MSKLLVVIPVMNKDVADICIDSLLMPKSAAGLNPEDILIVDNSKLGWGHEYGLRTYRDPDGHNLGTSRAWNVGAREVLAKKLDYLVIMSQSMRFGPELHTTWVKQMEAFWGAPCIEADGHSWHLIAIHRSVFEKVGLFDENFYPAYFEQIDFCYRMRMLDLEGSWPRVWVNALSQGVAIANETIRVPAAPLLAYYAHKWGGAKGEERFKIPFDSWPLDYWVAESIPELAIKYKLEVWW